MLADLSPLIAATAQWLTRAYPAGGGVLDATLCEVQARQAVTVAAWLRYPTVVDASLVGLVGPGGSARLYWITGTDGPPPGTDGDDWDVQAWRTWVDEVVVSWAACLLTDPALAGAAVAALADCEHTAGAPFDFRRLLTPDEHDRRAAALLRHPDLLAPVSALHHGGLLDRLKAENAPDPLLG
ncbi:hypothetical protein ACFY93_09930 [Streptomyces sp. NPDC008313]|uniref:hypothetical protein n=1 Tax=Streptomyces sp. NPDC008313 TaxID=3364826 RepID=UPI0036F12615